jgi:thiol-disulfide isomerase/thioredoxin
VRRSFILLVLLASLTACQKAPPSTVTAGPDAVTSGEGLTIKLSDKPVPMPALAVRDLDGNAIAADAWRGKVVLVNFWATWCGPCREEIPALIALQAHYREHVQVIGLSIDIGPPEKVKQFVTDAGVNYPVAIADEKLQDAFGGVPAVPSTFVVTPESGIIQRHVGLVDPRLLEHEIRVLSKLPTRATVQVVPDTGQVLLANAAYATEIPGLDLSHCTAAQREAVLKQLNTEKCSCGCGLTLAQCRINDPGCATSLPTARKILERIAR